ncbi:MAG: dihydrofolate reductase [Gammaproteobacteria bacterium]|nr:dihydrofolate reductase [Gammaproteobacteria bacterium]
MATKCSVFIATSLDGFIARKNGDLDWLPGSDGEMGSEDYGFNEFFTSVDTLVMGYTTYNLALTFNEWPYHGKHVVVLSSNFPKTPKKLAASVEGSSMPPKELIQRLATSGAAHIYVDGGKTIQGFLRADLIQGMTITRIPVLIGEGLPLFGPLPHDIKLQHLYTKDFESGFVQSKYKIVNPA